MNESFLYFAYGSGLNHTLIEFRVNEPVKILCQGELKNYSLKFNRRNPDGTARGNLHPAENEFTLGMLYQINQNKFEQLAQTEPAYRLTEFDIITADGTVKAFAFICHECADDVLPDKKYINGIVEYASLHGFPESYISKILSVTQLEAIGQK